ncbi:MAG: UDP-N-acetylmuramoyl-L-alanine--D-glutamate ligase [Clostridia bacterium]|nr:UDP-N-acetylmuramoyl-L-alanine--D-glutamate ligase [Clostridia bacterium]
MYQQLIDFFKDKSVLILGLGREGRATYSFLRKHYPDKKLYIADKNKVTLDDENARLICGENYLDCINNFDIVMQSPGISLRDVEIKEGTTVTGEMDLFLRFVPCKKIGITGTKGKTTTTTLTYRMLQAGGVPSMIMGNIGTPVFECIDEVIGKVAVIEMSCHQLEFAHASPDIAIFTNAYPEHLDHYNGFEGYIGAKLNIVRYQDEKGLFISSADQPLEEIVGSLDFIKSTHKRISCKAYEADEFFRHLTTLSEFLPGENQWQDIFFAATAVREFGVSDEAIEEAVTGFGGIAHRLEKINTKNGISFYDDAIATIPHAVLSNVKSLGNVGTLFIGGMDRGLDYSEFIDGLMTAPIDNLICMPETGYAIADALTAKNCKLNIVKCETLEEAVAKSFELTAPGKACLLSPAAASYNRYKNFEEKGNAFKALVASYDA